jgi:hypothetical protein
VTYYRIEAKLGVAGFCADDFPWEPFKEAMAAQVNRSVTIVDVADDSSACSSSRRRLGAVSSLLERRRLAGIKQAKVSYRVDYDADEQDDADLTTSTITSLDAAVFESALRDRILFYYPSVPADFGVPPDAIEAPAMVFMTPAPTPFPTVPPTEKDDEVKIVGLVPWQFALIVVGAILVLATIYLSLQPAPQKVEKVYINTDDASGDAKDESTKATSSPPLPPNPTLSSADAGAPGSAAPGSAPQARGLVAESPAARPATDPSPRERELTLSISPHAKRGPPVDLFTLGLEEVSDSEEE